VRSIVFAAHPCSRHGRSALTLIVSMLNRAYVLQVGDRLVTRRWSTSPGGTRLEPFDELANKCVIYVAADAVVSISYTGVAFIHGKPTDVWLAETLDADVAAGPHGALRVGGESERRITLGAAIKRVASKLAHDLKAMPARKRGSGVTLQLVGWQWQRRRPSVEMPIAWHIRNDGTGGTETTIHRYPRYWGWERNECRVAAVGDRRSDPVANIQRRLQDRSQLYAEFAEQVLVEAIREASASKLTCGSIGADCIAVWLRLSDGNLRVRYIPASPSHAAYDVFTPWVIMPTVGASAPSVLTAGLPTLQLGGLDVMFERAFPSTSREQPSMSSLQRPTDPTDP
jgi:hypothetical protein